MKKKETFNSRYSKILEKFDIVKPEYEHASEKLSPENEVDFEIINLYRDILELKSEIDNFISDKSYVIVKRLIDKYSKNKSPQFNLLKRLISDGIVLDIDKCLLHLGINKNTFYEHMKDAENFKVYYRQKLEGEINYLYDTMKDLDSEEKIGMFGQRLSVLFDNISNKYQEDLLPSDIRKLLEAKSDIEKLLFTNIQVYMKYQSAHDLGFYLDVAEYDNREALRNEIAKLNEEKENLLSEKTLLTNNNNALLEEIKINKETIENNNNSNARVDIVERKDELVDLKSKELVEEDEFEEDKELEEEDKLETEVEEEEEE